LRLVYDRHGVAGLEQQQQQQQQHHSSPQRNRNRPQLHVRVEVTLQDIDLGKDQTRSIEWAKPCSDCLGTGCKPGKTGHKCRECHGQGVMMHNRQVGPGIIQQSIVACPVCLGKGLYIHKADRCSTCKCSGSIQTTEQVVLRVQPGALDHSQLFPVNATLADQMLHHVVFELIELPHDRFHRLELNLICKTPLKITLVEALTGLVIRLRRLDGSTCVARTSLITKPGTIYRLPKQGIKGGGLNRGDLYIPIDIEFPTELTPQVKQILERCLPPPLKMPNDERKDQVEVEEEQVEMTVVDPTALPSAQQPHYPPPQRQHHHRQQHHQECHVQ
jgi:DnaJ-class molecular chaperone